MFASTRSSAHRSSYTRRKSIKGVPSIAKSCGSGEALRSRRLANPGAVRPCQIMDKFSDLSADDCICGERNNCRLDTEEQRCRRSQINRTYLRPPYLRTQRHVGEKSNIGEKSVSNFVAKHTDGAV